MLKSQWTDPANSENTVAVTTTVSVGTNRTTAPIWKVLKKSRAKFRAQLTQNTLTKRECIQACVHVAYEDGLRFWQDLLGNASRLLDSIRFNDYCVSRRLDPKAVAEHIVFEGDSVVKAVLKDGPHVIGEYVAMFGERLYEDAFGLYDGASEQE